MRNIPGVFLLCEVVFLSTGCAGLTDQQQRALTGGAIGATGGALVGGTTGAVLGGATGAAGGLLIHELEKDKGG